MLPGVSLVSPWCLESSSVGGISFGSYLPSDYEEKGPGLTRRLVVKTNNGTVQQVEERKREGMLFSATVASQHWATYAFRSPSA